ncbi:lycopene cyclase domain-containing protein [Planctomonas sp. JC2975]|nr:lycopene cyclase domain-containing protein [Planctomonas sp. JC2975]
MVLVGASVVRSDAYPLLALAFLLAAAAIAAMAIALRRRERREALRQWWAPALIAAVVVIVLTAVFDSLLIIADVIRYDERLLSGIRVWMAPVEDFAYPLAAILLVPSLWSIAGAMLRPRRPIDEPPVTGSVPAEEAPERAVPMGEGGHGR